MKLMEFLEKLEWADYEDKKACVEHLAAYRMRKTLALIEQLPKPATVPLTPTGAGTSDTTSGKTASRTFPATVHVTVTSMGGKS